MNTTPPYIKPEHPLLVIIGPSGVGKSTIVRRLVSDGVIELTKSWTTRPLRADETAERSEHVHIDTATFDRKVAEGFFLEHAQVFGLPYYYGMPRVELRDPARVPCILLRAMVLAPLQKYYTNYRVYQIEADVAYAKERMRSRGDQTDDIAKRLEIYTKELEAGRRLADRVFQNNDAYTGAYEQVVDTIRADFHL